MPLRSSTASFSARAAHHARPALRQTFRAEHRRVRLCRFRGPLHRRLRTKARRQRHMHYLRVRPLPRPCQRPELLDPSHHQRLCSREHRRAMRSALPPAVRPGHNPARDRVQPRQAILRPLSPRARRQTRRQQHLHRSPPIRDRTHVHLTSDPPPRPRQDRVPTATTSATIRPTAPVARPHDLGATVCHPMCQGHTPSTHTATLPHGLPSP